MDMKLGLFFKNKNKKENMEFIWTSKNNYCVFAKHLIVKCPLCNELMFGKALQIKL